MSHENKIIKRFISSEVRMDSIDSKSRTISGYAALFNSETNIYGDYYEIIAPGAFANAIATSDTVCLFNHEENFICGRKSSGTLRLSEDSKGLPFSCDLPMSREDVLESITRKDVTGCSFSFTIKKDSMEEREDGSILRTIIEIDKLYDVGPVVFPAYNDTSVDCDSEIKSFEAFREERKRLKSDASKTVEPDYSQYEQIITLQKHTF